VRRYAQKIGWGAHGAILLGQIRGQAEPLSVIFIPAINPLR